MSEVRVHTEAPIEKDVFSLQISQLEQVIYGTTIIFHATCRIIHANINFRSLEPTISAQARRERHQATDIARDVLSHPPNP